MTIYQDSEFGEVLIVPNRQARRLIFRVKDGVLRVTCPVGFREKDIIASIAEHREPLRRLFARAAKTSQPPVVTVGDRIPFYGGEIVLLPGVRGRGLIVKSVGENIELHCPPEYDLGDERVWSVVSKYVCRMVKRRAERALPQRLVLVSSRLGLKPVPVSIGRGRNKLGHCTARGEIQLSFRLMFYPEEIIDYIICHELAHLTHMNHSPEFHALCNQYCGGREGELRRKTREFKVAFS